MSEGARSMDPEPINPAALGPPRGYAHGMLAPAGARLLFVAGQIGWDAQQRLVSTAFADQFRQALLNLLAVVTAAGGDARHLVRMTAYVTDKREYQQAIKAVGAAWREVLGRHFPAMSLVQVADLLEDGAKVELEATAAIPSASAPHMRQDAQHAALHGDQAR